MRRPGESWIQFDRRLMRLSLATIAAAPADYAAWIVGAAARSIGHATVLNLPFALGTLALAAAFVLRRRPGDAAAGRPTDIDTLAWLTGAWWLGAIALPVLVSFAAQRYIDSAALLLAVWPFYGLIRIVCRARGDQPARA